MSLPKQERRRRRLHDEGEDVGAENPTVVTRSSECESEDETPTIELSEYESAVDDSGADQEDETEEGSETETEEGSETEDSGSETEGCTDEEGIAEERQSGDGEEQPNNDKPDDDEDKKNPAYVPRKGAFYEHDFRRGAEGTEAEVTEEAKPKKKLWQDEGKWTHDRYIDNMQEPKSRQELIEIYGYDIRSADRPPEAPPRRQQRAPGPRKQNFKDFIPRMAVIDTTEGGQDSVPNLDDDEFIQYKKSLSRNTHGNTDFSTETRRGGRGGSRGNYRGSDIETKNIRNRQDSSRINQDGHRNVQLSTEDPKTADFPSLVESARPGIPKDVQGLKRGDNNDRMFDAKFSDRNQKFNQSENHDKNSRDEYRLNNTDKFHQTQDIRRQEDIRGKNRSQQVGFREERRDGFNPIRGRDQGINSQSEKWRNVPNDFRDSYNKVNSYNGSVADYGYNARKQQQQMTGGNRAPRAGNSGDTGGYFNNNNNRGNRGFEQPVQQTEMAGALNKDAREYTNSSYKYSEVKTKPKIVQNYSTVPATDNSGGSDTDPANSKSLVISNKENVQTINVTITSTTTEKKSYAKERRAKGISRPMDGAVMVGGTDIQTSVAPISGNPYQSLPPASSHIDVPPAPLSTGTNPYSSHRQQGIFAEPPLVGGAGAKLYNPSLPPPSFYQREHGGLPPGQHPTLTPPALLPPTTALPFGLPVSSPGLALPPNAAGMPTNPALFQPPTGPPPASSIAAPPTAMIAAQFLPAGMMYGGAPRVPPPGAPTAFPLTLAYTSPPPQGAVAAAVVGNQPPSQGTAPAQAIQTTAQHKKVYRGDITYYAPELQQPSRTPQKRPKAAIPIIDPQEVPGQKVKEKSEQRFALEQSSRPASKFSSNDNTSKTMAQSVEPPTTLASTLVSKATEGLNQHIHHGVGQDPTPAINSSAVLSKGVAASLAQHEIASLSFSPNTTEDASSYANISPLVSHAGNLSEGSEHKRMAIITELSPGGPPVNNSTSNVAVLNKEQSVCIEMQNLQVSSSVNKIEVAAVSSSGSGDLRQEVCEKLLPSTSES